MDGDSALKNASEEVFPCAPTLLCIWHVNQCVLANCKSVVGDEGWEVFQAAWHAILAAPTIEQFDKLWLEFKTQYSNPKTYKCISYLQKEWLKDGQKERLLAAHTNQYLHFGIRTTSRNEGAHAYIKRYLGGKKSKGDLYSSWLRIEAAVINQIAAVSTRTNTLRDRIPIDIDKKLYHGCFGVVTWHALRLVQQHLETVSLPLRPCTGRFVRSMGLPCAHICDVRRPTGGLTPSDFHGHWFWDRKSAFQPLLDPLWAGRQRNKANLQVHHTGRIPSTGEELPVKQPPVCSACHIRGHTRSSRNCPLKLQASIASQSQILLDLEVAGGQPLAPVVPATTISITASVPAFVPPTATFAPIAPVVPPLGSKVSIDVQLSSPRTFTAPPATIKERLQPPKRLSPNRPEVLIKAYLAEKTAWLAKHPAIRPTEYRKARKWKNPRPKVLKEQVFYMPKERRDLGGNIVAAKANWTSEEIISWLDNEERREEEEYKKLQSEFIGNGHRHAESTHQEMWNRAAEEVAGDFERYIL
ncbi:hypothetical protein MAJ_09156, partial [Metarhizium majus ARSEF 297]